ncbi:acyl-CoA dehydrogenase family protein [Microbacterium sp. 18062]|uniref:acyl-CoA dehydrogenase family protein n=1 Tax=Microbacterium sp. 18062 TaxID=2681410 RepID=UPI0013586F1C|nr:acyl-CoA dehydrogenase family protein [Microbacterium sp. 18062]
MTALRRVLTDDLLATFHERAPRYDEENAFFAEDLDDLREVGYLRAAVPEELGGLGLTIQEVLAEQRRLAYWTPATALALNMHLYWTGSAADAHRRGDATFDWLLREGRVIAAGHGERGNDAVIDDSTTKAVPVDGGYRFTGRKVFTSLSPAWSRTRTRTRARVRRTPR